MKKYLSIIGIVAVIVAVGLGSYYYFVFDEIDPQTGEKVGFREFLPFGSNSDAEPVRNNEGDEQGFTIPDNAAGDPAAPILAPTLLKVSDGPVAGTVAISSGNIHYTEGANGNLHEYVFSARTPKRLTNTTITKVRESVWNPNGSGLVFRYPNDNDLVESYAATIGTSTATSTEDLRALNGAFLPTNINEVVFLGSSGKIFYLQTINGGARGYVSNMNGSSPVLVFTSPAREWAVQGVDANTVLLTTKPSSYAKGFSYELDVKTGSMKKLVGNVTGLTALLSHKKDYLLYSENGQSGLVLKLLNIKNGTVSSLGLSTVAEKCVWDENSHAFCAAQNSVHNRDFIDLWNQGVVSSSDDIWEIDPSTGVVDPIFAMAESPSAPFDIIDIKVASGSKAPHLYFINRKDSSLWTLVFPEPEEGGATSTKKSPTT